MTMNIHGAVNALTFNIVNRFRDTNKNKLGRFMNGVYIEPSPRGGVGVVMVATDGYNMMTGFDPLGYIDKPAVVELSKDAIKRLKPRRGTHGLRLELDGDKASIQELTDDGEVSSQTVTQLIDHEGDSDQYPEYWRVYQSWVDRDEGNHSATFQPAMMERFAKAAYDAARWIGDNKPRTKIPAMMSVTTKTSTGATFIEFDDLPFVGLIMPIKGTANHKLPDWLDRA